MNTCKSARLWSSLHTLAIQYLRSGEHIADDQLGSLPVSKIGSTELSEREERKISMEAKLECVK